MNLQEWYVALRARPARRDLGRGRGERPAPRRPHLEARRAAAAAETRVEGHREQLAWIEAATPRLQAYPHARPANR